MIGKGLALRLALVREESTLSQKDFGKKLNNTSRSSIILYENGQRIPPLAFIVDLCQTFGINPNWLIFETLPKYLEGADVCSKESAAELLERSLQAMKTTEPKKMKLSRYVGKDIDEITADTPANYLRLFSDMKDNPRLREQIFMLRFCENRE